MHSRSILAVIIVVVGVFFFFGCQEEPADATAPAAPRAVQASEQPGPAPFIVTTSGTVERLEDGVWESIEVGEVLAAGARIRTGRDSSCQVQFASIGLVHLGSNSEFEARSTVLADSERLFELKLIRGTAAASVRELTRGNSFRVSTAKAVARVRGTEFVVQKREDGGVLVGVQEGSVEVLPSTLDLERLAAGGDDDETGALVDALRRAASYVEDGEQIEFSSEELEQAGLSFRGLDQQIEEYLAGRGAGSLLGEILDLAEDAADELAPAEKIEPLSGEALEKLKPIRERKMIPAEFMDSDGEPSLDELVRVSIRTIPDNAEIVIDGEIVGKTTFSSVYQGTREVNIIVRKDGYAQRVVQIPDGGTVNEILAVQLRKLPPSVTPSSFLQAVASNNMSVVREYIMTGGDVNVRNEADLPALAIALDFVDYYFTGAEQVYSYDMEMVDVLLGAGADPNAEFLFAGELVTPFFMALATSLATESVDLELVDALLSAGADVDKLVVAQNMVVTPLAMAVIVGIENENVNMELVRALIEAGGDPRQTIEYAGRRMSVVEASRVLSDEHGYRNETLVSVLRQ